MDPLTVALQQARAAAFNSLTQQTVSQFANIVMVVSRFLELVVKEPPRKLGINPESGGRVWMVQLKK